MTNEELVIRIKAGINVADNMLQLWKQCYRFIHLVAVRYDGKAELEDLEQEGYLALYDAIDGFIPENGYKFLTYAGHWINQRMQRYIQKNGTVKIPTHKGEKIREYKRLVNAYLVYLGRKPSRQEIAAQMHLPHKDIIELEKTLQFEKIASLDNLLTVDGDAMLSDTIPANINVEADVTERMQCEQLKEAIWSCVDALPEQQRFVIRERFQKGVTYATIGECMGVSTEKVRQTEYKALRNIRHSKSARLLRSFLTNETLYNMGIIGNGVKRFNTTWTSSTERAAMLGIK